LLEIRMNASCIAFMHMCCCMDSILLYSFNIDLAMEEGRTSEASQSHRE
jgi:hypothetical protein